MPPVEGGKRQRGEGSRVEKRKRGNSDPQHTPGAPAFVRFKNAAAGPSAGRSGGGPKAGNGPQQLRARADALLPGRLALPVASVRDELLAEVRCSTSLVVVAETGSGKTTQLPQFLHEAGFGPIAITQPRRVAAISAAGRVAEEVSVSRT